MSEIRVIATEVDYLPLHRFRIWKAVVDDVQRLKIGHRNYLVHIHEQFEFARSMGIKIFDHAKRSLDASSLTESDVLRFLKNGGNMPTKTQKQITKTKVRIFDALMQIKYPNVSATFKPDNIVHEFGSIATSFYNNEQMLATNSKLNNAIFKRLAIFTGSYPINLDIRKYALDKSIMKLPFLSFRYEGSGEYCLVDSIDLPVQIVEREDVKSKSSPDMKNYELRIAEGPIKIFSGVCVPARIQQFGIDRGCFSILLAGTVLRDQKTAQIAITLNGISGENDDKSIEGNLVIDSFKEFQFASEPMEYYEVSPDSTQINENLRYKYSLYNRLGKEIIDIVSRIGD